MPINQTKIHIVHSITVLERWKTLWILKKKNTCDLLVIKYGLWELDSKDVNEETPCKPIGIYGTLKYSGEFS